MNSVASNSVTSNTVTSEMGRTSVFEKVGYSLGDFAANLVFQTQIVFLLNFYTDIMKLPAATVGTMFLISRLIDALTDPLMGAIADRTRTRWGRFRPWVLWTAIPFAVLFVLTYTVPDLEMRGRLIWAYVTYNLLMLVYTANNIPYSALMGVLTGNSYDRTTLASYRFMFVMMAAFVVQVWTLDLIDWISPGRRDLGYPWVIGVFAVVTVLCFLITFLSTRERVQPDAEQTSTLKQDLRDLAANGPWIALFLLTVSIFISLALRGGMTLFYFNYYLQREDLFSRFNAVGLIASMAGILLSRPLAVRFGKKNSFQACLFATAVLIALFVFLEPTQIVLVFTLQILSQFAYGVTIPMLWAMMADVADYSEWRTGRRATGLVFSAATLGLKLGLSLGGALSGWLLDLYGYQPDAIQTESALRGIRYLMSVFPAFWFFVGVVVLFFYEINKSLSMRIESDLAARRAGIGGLGLESSPA